MTDEKKLLLSEMVLADKTINMYDENFDKHFSLKTIQECLADVAIEENILGNVNVKIKKKEIDILQILKLTWNSAVKSAKTLKRQKEILLSQQKYEFTVATLKALIAGEIGTTRVMVRIASLVIAASAFAGALLYVLRNLYNVYDYATMGIFVGTLGTVGLDSVVTASATGTLSKVVVATSGKFISALTLGLTSNPAIALPILAVGFVTLLVVSKMIFDTIAKKGIKTNPATITKLENNLKQTNSKVNSDFDKI